eukprot:6074745-Pyramimonas_sp.AAC.1
MTLTHGLRRKYNSRRLRRHARGRQLVRLPGHQRPRGAGGLRGRRRLAPGGVRRPRRLATAGGGALLGGGDGARGSASLARAAPPAGDRAWRPSSGSQTPVSPRPDGARPLAG